MLLYEALTQAIVQGEGYDVVTGRNDLSRDAAINTPPDYEWRHSMQWGKTAERRRVANTCNGSKITLDILQNLVIVQVILVPLARPRCRRGTSNW